MVLLAFIASAVFLLGTAVILRPSFYIVMIACFLTLGFLLKLVATLTFGVPLIEPTGSFSGSFDQWDTALKFAAAGHFGGAVAIVVAAFLPSLGRTASFGASPPRIMITVLWLLLVLLIIIAMGVYDANYRYTILRIGYPLGVSIDARLYAVLAFVLTWGALMGGLALAQWLIDFRALPHFALILIASLFGFLAALTMGSRVQFILYILVAVSLTALRWRTIRRWTGVILSFGLSGILFVVSIGAVSVERNYAFQGGGTKTPQQVGSKAGATALERLKPDAPSIVPVIVEPGNSVPLTEKIEVVTSAGRFRGLLAELRSLIVMRWVGLEGVLTTASRTNDLGIDLLRKGLAEDPAVGKGGIYQKMSGDRYGQVTFFTFLTLPGVIGIASYSGSLTVIFAFVMCVFLLGHGIETFTARITGNPAAAAVCGVSLAYLTAQMGYPWTIVVYAAEISIAAIMLGLLWILLNQISKMPS